VLSQGGGNTSKHRLILFLGADWWGSDARALAVALRHRGNALIEIIDEDFLPLQWSSFPLRVLRRLARPLFLQNYNQAVAAHAGNPALDFVLVFKGKMLQAATLENFRKHGKPIYCFYPDVSFLDHGSEIGECLPRYDCVFTTKSYHLADSGLRNLVKQMKLVSHGFDPEVHRPVILSAKVQLFYGCDVSFVGCWSPKKEKLLATVLAGCPKARLHIWGPGWQRASEALRRCWRGRGVFGDELAIVYACSAINLGLLSEAGGGTQSGDLTTARTWQIPGSGGFMLHEATEELARYFLPGREVAVFSTPEEMTAKIRHYLEHPEERACIAAAGHRRSVESGYTHERTAEEILQFHSLP